MSDAPASPEIASLVARAKAYATRAKLAHSTVSLRLFKDSKRLAALEKGSWMRPRVIAAALIELGRAEGELAAKRAAKADIPQNGEAA